MPPPPTPPDEHYEFVNFFDFDFEINGPPDLAALIERLKAALPTASDVAVTLQRVPSSSRLRRKLMTALPRVYRAHVTTHAIDPSAQHDVEDEITAIQVTPERPRTVVDSILGVHVTKSGAPHAANAIVHAPAHPPQPFPPQPPGAPPPPPRPPSTPPPPPSPEPPPLLPGHVMLFHHVTPAVQLVCLETTLDVQREIEEASASSVYLTERPFYALEDNGRAW